MPITFRFLRVVRRAPAFFLFTLLAIGALNFPLMAQTPDSPTTPPRVRAPELTGGRSWLNTDKPLSLVALKGKVVLLDFWTYGCVNCIHIIPDLKRLEAKYPNQLVVIGVHSAKFANEKETENIRRIVLRYEIEHPVVNDADFKIWNAYAVNAWPTRILIDPAGYVVGVVRGEGEYEALDQVIGQLVTDFRKRGELNETPLKLALERAQVGDLPLAFPGKVLADAKGNRLFISDSNHNRIVVTNLDGKLIETIGTGAVGKTDGAFAQATFNRPQGLALSSDGATLYVADTENHLIRRVDLQKQAVTTIAGTGEQLKDFGVIKPQAARSVALTTPWDLQLVGNNLYIAMAGNHQLWKLDLTTMLAGTFAGSGREARVDGARVSISADGETDFYGSSAFAQPSGLSASADGSTLYVADSESNIIRAVALAENKTVGDKELQVETLAGGDLFDFGDVDNVGDDVRLQHPLGVAFYQGRVLIADTYNHKIKSLDPTTRTVKTLEGTGKPGQTDGAQAAFYEPGGLSVAGDKLYIADTNNQAIRVTDLKTGATSTLTIKGLTAPQNSASEPEAETVSAPNAQVINADSQTAYVGKLDLQFNVKLPAGYHLNSSAPQRLQAVVETNSTATTDAKPATTKPAIDAPATFIASNTTNFNLTDRKLTLPVNLPLQVKRAGQFAVRVNLTLFYCRDDDTGLCRIKTLTWRVPVTATSLPAGKGGGTGIALEETISAPE